MTRITKKFVADQLCRAQYPTSTNQTSVPHKL